jgi:proline iminopeptidase
MRSNEGYVTTPDGVRLYFQALGDGPKVLLPNGIHLVDDFARLADGRMLIFYDVRNRGLSDTITDASKLRGVADDVDDLDTVRRHFEIDRADLIGHSYTGSMLACYAMKHPGRVNRMVQIGPIQPDPATQYPAHLTNADATLTEVFSKLAEMQKEMSATEDPQTACERFWSVLRRLYVVDAADEGKIKWGRCDVPNERMFMGYFTQIMLPSIQKVDFSAEALASVEAPVLVVHGNRDRSAPYGGGRDWAMRFPNARLLTVENAAHAPWIEAPELVLDSIGTFLDGAWPEMAQVAS